jgi:hypothetical protein
MTKIVKACRKHKFELVHITKFDEGSNYDSRGDYVCSKCGSRQLASYSCLSHAEWEAESLRRKCTMCGLSHMHLPEYTCITFMAERIKELEYKLKEIEHRLENASVNF